MTAESRGVVWKVLTVIVSTGKGALGLNVMVKGVKE